jgi:hypothetical protein
VQADVGAEFPLEGPPIAYGGRTQRGRACNLFIGSVAALQKTPFDLEMQRSGIPAGSPRIQLVLLHQFWPGTIPSEIPGYGASDKSATHDEHTPIGMAHAIRPSRASVSRISLTPAGDTS